MALRLTYRPETVNGNDLITRFACGPDGTIFTTETHDFDGNDAWSTSLIQATRKAQQDDVLPSQLIQTLISDHTKGARIPAAVFDGDTWGRFDNYCNALGIWFSLSLVEQSSALAMANEIAESANALLYWSAGVWKIAPRETASVTGNGFTFTPRPEHSASCRTFDPADLRAGIKITRTPLADRKNVLPVTYKDRTRNYQDVSPDLRDEGSIQLMGERRAQALSCPWITRSDVMTKCGTLRLRREVRALNRYTFDAPQKCVDQEVGDLVTISDPAGGISARVVRITRIEDSGSWITFTAEDAFVAASSEGIPEPSIPEPFPTLVAPAVNSPIVFAAPASLTGAGPQIWALVSWPDGSAGARVQASLDGGSSWSEIGLCTSESPTGWLQAGAENLTPRTDLVPHYGLVPGLFDRITAADLSESGLSFPTPVGTQWMDAAPGALLWIDGELVSYRRLISALPDQLIHGRHGTTPSQHPLPARIGVVTSAAFKWIPPAGSGGVEAKIRFVSLGAPSHIDQAESAGTTITITIPAGV